MGSAAECPQPDERGSVSSLLVQCRCLRRRRRHSALQLHSSCKWPCRFLSYYVVGSAPPLVMRVGVSRTVRYLILYYFIFSRFSFGFVLCGFVRCCLRVSLTPGTTAAILVSASDSTSQLRNPICILNVREKKIKFPWTKKTSLLEEATFSRPLRRVLETYVLLLQRLLLPPSLLSRNSCSKYFFELRLSPGEGTADTKTIIKLFHSTANTITIKL